MKYKIVFILVVIFLTFFLVAQISGKEGRLGISELNCVKWFESAGVYNEELGIYHYVCEAEVSPEYNCYRQSYDTETGESKCLD